jgi:putative ABC transport system substrate-binding protein
MNRRETLIALLTLGVASFGAEAQQKGKVWRIGILSPDASASETGIYMLSAFTSSLKRLGYQVGKNIILDCRWGDGESDHLQAFARELARLGVDVIVAQTNEPIDAAMSVTHTIPIVMHNAWLPVDFGFVQSLARPGANVTGTSFQVESGLLPKQLQLLKEIAPHVGRVAYLENANLSKTRIGRLSKDIIRRDMEQTSTSLGVRSEAFQVERSEEIASALEKIAASRCDALYYRGEPFFRGHAREIVAFLRKRRLPSVGAIPGFAEQGGLFVYAAEANTAVYRTARYVDRILKGATPADLPVEQPTKFNLVINLKTAKVIGLTIPQSVLVRADRVIE